MVDIILDLKSNILNKGNVSEEYNTAEKLENKIKETNTAIDTKANELIEQSDNKYAQKQDTINKYNRIDYIVHHDFYKKNVIDKKIQDIKTEQQIVDNSQNERVSTIQSELNLEKQKNTEQDTEISKQINKVLELENKIKNIGIEESIKEVQKLEPELYYDFYTKTFVNNPVGQEVEGKKRYVKLYKLEEIDLPNSNNIKYKDVDKSLTQNGNFYSALCSFFPVEDKYPNEFEPERYQKTILYTKDNLHKETDLHVVSEPQINSLCYEKFTKQYNSIYGIYKKKSNYTIENFMYSYYPTVKVLDDGVKAFLKSLNTSNKNCLKIELNYETSRWVYSEPKLWYEDDNYGYIYYNEQDVYIGMEYTNNVCESPLVYEHSFIPACFKNSYKKDIKKLYSNHTLPCLEILKKLTPNRKMVYMDTYYSNFKYSLYINEISKGRYYLDNLLIDKYTSPDSMSSTRAIYFTDRDEVYYKYVDTEESVHNFTISVSRNTNNMEYDKFYIEIPTTLQLTSYPSIYAKPRRMQHTLNLLENYDFTLDLIPFIVSIRLRNGGHVSITSTNIKKYPTELQTILKNYLGSNSCVWVYGNNVVKTNEYEFKASISETVHGKFMIFKDQYTNEIYTWCRSQDMLNTLFDNERCYTYNHKTQNTHTVPISIFNLEDSSGNNSKHVYYLLNKMYPDA